MRGNVNFLVRFAVIETLMWRKSNGERLLRGSVWRPPRESSGTGRLAPVEDTVMSSAGWAGLGSFLYAIITQCYLGEMKTLWLLQKAAACT